MSIAVVRSTVVVIGEPTIEVVTVEGCKVVDSSVTVSVLVAGKTTDPIATPIISMIKATPTVARNDALLIT